MSGSNDDEQVGFYQAGFNEEGRPVDFHKGGRNAASLFEVDTENRVLTFARL
jgi:hypothetical protein